MKKLISMLGIAGIVAFSNSCSQEYVHGVYREENLPKKSVKDLPDIKAEQLVGYIFTKEFFTLQYHIKGKKGAVAFLYPIPKDNSPLFCPTHFTDDLDDNKSFDSDKGEVFIIDYGDQKPSNCILYSPPKEKKEKPKIIFPGTIEKKLT